MRAEYLAVIAREALGGSRFTREPEPEVMEDKEQVEAFAEAGRIPNATLASHLFNVAHASEVLVGARHVVDLGCGPATQLLKLAALHPGTRFTGVDLSDEMLRLGQEELAASGLDNVSLLKGDITRLPGFADGSVDGVMSTMTLHHLPTVDHLAACFREARRVLAPGGAVFLTDFCRLRSLRSVHFFSHMNERELARPVIVDYENSLKAAFSKEEYLERLPLLGDDLQFATTFLVTLLGMAHTPKRPLPPALRARFGQMRAELPARIRKDLDDLRTFFRVGGLKGDPFAA
jgi:arsenite methyltransferase